MFVLSIATDVSCVACQMNEARWLFARKGEYSQAGSCIGDRRRLSHAVKSSDGDDRFSRG